MNKTRSRMGLTIPQILFMGTPDFSVQTLDALVAGGLTVQSVFTQPPRPSGRKMQIRPSPVHRRALDLGLTVHTPDSFQSESVQSHFEALCHNHSIDLAVVVAYGQILPPRILAAPRLGCLNIHASLLPRWRGAAPIQRAIAAGDTETGITYMKMDTGLDTGAVLRQIPHPIGPEDTGADLHDSLSRLGANGIIDMVQDILQDRTRPVAQPSDGITYAHKLAKHDGLIDWTRPAIDCHRHQRALTPWPGAFTRMTRFPNTSSVQKDIDVKNSNTVRLKIVESRVSPTRTSERPGTMIRSPMVVACGENTCLEITQLQHPGKAIMTSAAYLRGTPLPKGTLFF